MTCSQIHVQAVGDKLILTPTAGVVRKQRQSDAASGRGGYGSSYRRRWLKWPRWWHEPRVLMPGCYADVRGCAARATWAKMMRWPWMARLLMVAILVVAIWSVIML
jgi:hypothetical protein